MNPSAVSQFSSHALLSIAEPALRAIVMAALAALTLWIGRMRSASAQLAAWTLVLCAALLLPLLGWLLPPIFVRLPIRQSQPQPATQQNIRLANSSDDLIRVARMARAAKPIAIMDRPRTVPFRTIEQVTPVPGSVPARWPLFAFGAYLFVLGMLAARLFVGFRLTRRMRRRAASIHDPAAQRLIREFAGTLRVRHSPQLLESPAVNVPLTLGVFRPVIVVPRGWREWEEAKLTAVIAHELSHVRRRDSFIRLLATVYRSIFWFSPLGWWLEHHLADLGERASDQAAISAGTEPTYYAEVLMSFFQTIQNGQGRLNWLGVAMAGRGRSVNRIERVLSLKVQEPSAWSKPPIVATIAGALPLLCLMAAARPKLVLASAAAPQPAAEAQASPAPQPAPAVPAAPPVLPGIGPAAAPGVSPVAPVPPRIRLTAPPVPKLQPISPLVSLMRFRSDDGVTYRSSNFNGAMDFAIVSGNSVTMNGSDDDRRAVESLRKRISGDFIWFVHDGTAYTISDEATVKAAKQLYAQMDDLGKQQEALGRDQEELGKQQDALGRQMEAIRVDVPADLMQRLQAVEAKIKGLGGSADMDELGRLQGELGDLQYQLGSLQRKAGDAQHELGEQQRALGEKQQDVGRQQRDLGRKQADLGLDAGRRMQDVINKALTSGAAKRVE